MTRSVLSQKRVPSAARARQRAAAGFTMVELTVALVAGLIVALAVAGLSKEATRTFNEEVRVSAAEAALRTAVDRLRADLGRAAYMSTANMQMDPTIATPFGQANVYPAITAGAYTGIASLAGIHYRSATTATTASTNGLLLDAVNAAVAPAIIDIGGNMTSTEQFQLQDWLPGQGAGGTCTRLDLAGTSPPIFRMLNAGAGGAPDSNADTEMANIFAPVANKQFLVRIYDDSGKSQFLPTCLNATPAVAGVFDPTSTTSPQAIKPYVYVQGTPIRTADTAPGSGGIGGNGAGKVYVNPVQVVRWEIVGPAATADTESAADLAGLGATAQNAALQDPNKYDLIRSYLDSSGAWIAASAEVVAEYAVDMDFAFSVDTTTDATGMNSVITTYDFGDPNNQQVADLVKANIAGPNTPDPQRIRSVRFRLVTRASTPDRSLNISAGAPFLYRYCLNTGGCPATSTAAAGVPPQWARTRTIVSEVSLPNQAQAFY